MMNATRAIILIPAETLITDCPNPPFEPVHGTIQNSNSIDTARKMIMPLTGAAMNKAKARLLIISPQCYSSDADNNGKYHKKNHNC
ncbi:MAG: hypothetical protein Phog2KO_30590 [Phototrophicaceae bacterium]